MFRRPISVYHHTEEPLTLSTDDLSQDNRKRDKLIISRTSHGHIS